MKSDWPESPIRERSTIQRRKTSLEKSHHTKQKRNRQDNKQKTNEKRTQKQTRHVRLHEN